MGLTKIWGKEDPNTHLNEVEILVGQYVLEFDTKYVPNWLIPDKITPRQITLAGKGVSLDNWVVKDNGDTCILWLTVLKNPIPLIAILSAVAVIGVTAAFALNSVSKVSADVVDVVKSPPVALLILGVAAFLLAPYIREFTGRKKFLVSG